MQYFFFGGGGGGVVHYGNVECERSVYTENL